MKNGQMHTWDDVLAPHLETEQRRLLAGAHVGIAGAGGLGSNCAVLLARCGIGHLTIADHDLVSLSNLNRQFFWPRHVGKPKVHALAESLRELNPALSLSLHQIRLDAGTCRTVFAPCPVVVEAVDEPCVKRLLVESLLADGHQVISASGMGGWGGPRMDIRHVGSRLTVVGDFVTEAGCGNPPLAPRVVMAAALQADAVLCRILGPGGFQN